MNPIPRISLREVVAALMCSGLYFDMTPRERLCLAKHLTEKYCAKAA